MSSAPTIRTDVMDCLDRASKIVAETRYPIRSKPALGGRFGAGGFYLCSYYEIHGGLDHVLYFVSHSSGYVLGTARTAPEALAIARDVLSSLDPMALQARMQKHEAWLIAERNRRQNEHDALADQRRQDLRARLPNVRSISRRRRRIFEEGGGACHYCSTTLTLDGTWHIEHKMPKALGGGNEPGNLVASCAPCNHKKRDTTDVEFKAKLAKETA